ncbi:MAG: hypothetical protein MSH18_04385 [Bacteroidales bacterium]|nr:hypothetical protein [Bacteroidales bacterium]
MVALTAYSFFENKPSALQEYIENTPLLALFQERLIPNPRNWIVTGEVLSSDASIVNADSIGIAVSLRQDDSKTVKSNISIERYGILPLFISII